MVDIFLNTIFNVGGQRFVEIIVTIFETDSNVCPNGLRIQGNRKSTSYSEIYSLSSVSLLALARYPPRPRTAVDYAVFAP